MALCILDTPQAMLVAEALDTDRLAATGRSVGPRTAHLRGDSLHAADGPRVEKPERIVALSLVMALRLLVYRLAEHRLRQRLATIGQTVPTQLRQPTNRPTMRWMVQCFEGVSLVIFPPPCGPPHREISDLQPLREQMITLAGLSCQKLYKADG